MTKQEATIKLVQFIDEIGLCNDVDTTKEEEDIEDDVDDSTAYMADLTFDEVFVGDEDTQFFLVFNLAYKADCTLLVNKYVTAYIRSNCFATDMICKVELARNATRHQLFSGTFFCCLYGLHQFRDMYLTDVPPAEMDVFFSKEMDTRYRAILQFFFEDPIFSLPKF